MSLQTVEPKQQNDEELSRAMQAVADGSAEAFRTVAEALEPRLERFFAQLGVPASDRDDLYQETCLRIYRSAGTFDTRRPLMPWALTVARRVMLNWHRARKPTVPLDETIDVAGEQPTPSATAERDLWIFVRSRLAPEAYELLWLCYGEDLTPSEISAATGRTSVHVRVLLYRARNALARELEKEEHPHATKQVKR